MMNYRKTRNKRVLGLIFFCLTFLACGIYMLLVSESEFDGLIHSVIVKITCVTFCAGLIWMFVHHYFNHLR